MIEQPTLVAIGVFVGGGAIAWILAAIYATRRGTLSLYDFGAVLVAPIVLFVIAGLRNTGWAMIIWPPVAWTVFMYIFAAKVFVLDRVARNAHQHSKWLFRGAMTACLIAGLTVPQWDE